MAFKLGYPMYFTLDEQRRPVPVPDDNVLIWADWWEKHRFLADDEIGSVRIATIFLGIDPDHGESETLLACSRRRCSGTARLCVRFKRRPTSRRWRGRPCG